MADEPDWFRVVAEERCEECGMRVDDLARADLGAAILDESDRWGDLLMKNSGPEQWRKRRPGLAWSTLEYAAHVRDVLALFGPTAKFGRRRGSLIGVPPVGRRAGAVQRTLRTSRACRSVRDRARRTTSAPMRRVATETSVSMAIV